MLSKLRRLYRGLCWLMDTDFEMPWARQTTSYQPMTDLSKIQGRVAVLEEQRQANAGTWCRLFDLETNVGDHVHAVHKRLAALEKQQAEAQPVICSPVESLQKMSLAAVTEEHFDAIGAYVMEAILEQAPRMWGPKVISEALQAYAKGDR